MADAGELKAVVSAETSDFISKMNDLATTVQDATEKATGQFGNMQDAVDKASGALEGLKSTLDFAAEIAGFTVGFQQIADLLKDVATDAVTTYTNLEQVSAAMTALTGSATATSTVLNELKTIAGSTLFSFPDLAQAAQKMSALGIAASDIPHVLEAVANAAETLNEPLGSVADVMDRVYTGGNLMAKSLAALGLTWQDLGKAMGDTSNTAKQVLLDFNSLQDGMDKVNILTDALNTKFADAAQAMQGTLAFAISSVKNAWDDLLVEFGKEVAPDLKNVLNDLRDILPVIGEVTGKMVDLAAVAFDTELKSLSDLKAIFVDIRSVLPDVSTRLAEVQSWLEKISGQKLDPNSILSDILTHGLLGGLADLPAVIGNVRAGMDNLTDAMSRLPLISAQGVKATQDLQTAMFATTGTVHDFSQAWGTIGVLSIEQLKQIGVIATDNTDPAIKKLNDSAQTLFEDFGRGFQGIFDDWNQAAAGIDPTKLLADLDVLKAKFEQEGATGAANYGLVTDAIKVLDDWMLNHIIPDTTNVGESIQNANQKIMDAFNKTSTSIGTTLQSLTPLDGAFKQLGIDAEGETTKIQRDMNAVDALIQNQSIVQVGDLDIAWSKLTADAGKYANDPGILPKIIDYQQKIVDQLTAEGAPLGDIYNKLTTIRTEQINLATEQGNDATAYMVQLANIKEAQQGLKDQTQAWGQLYTDLLGDFNNAFTTLGNAIADNIIAGKNWGDTLLNAADAIAKKILEDIVNTALKALRGWMIDNLPLFKNLGDIWTGIATSTSSAAANAAKITTPPFIPGASNSPLPGPLPGSTPTGGGGTGGAGGVGSAASGTLGSIESAATAIGAVGTFITGVIGDIQNAHQTDILKSIEYNTRVTAMWIGPHGGSGVGDWTWLTAMHTEPLKNIDGWIHDAWVELLSDFAFLNGTLLGTGGWVHDYFANGLGPAVDHISGNTDQMLSKLDALIGAKSSASATDAANAATLASQKQTVQATQAAQQSAIQVTVTTPALVTKDAANALADQIARNLANQLIGSSIR